MNEGEIKRLVKILEESSVSELEIRRWGRSIRIAKKPSHLESSPVPQSGTTVSPPAVAADSTNLPTQTANSPAKTGIEQKSPMVGTFYRAPAPNADPYVQVNQVIKKGQVLCIIEAMKLMNEIESEFEGRVAEILVENGQPVEYNQPLFVIEPI